MIELRELQNNGASCVNQYKRKEKKAKSDRACLQAKDTDLVIRTDMSK